MQNIVFGGAQDWRKTKTKVLQFEPRKKLRFLGGAQSWKLNLTEVLNPTKKHFGGSPPKVVFLGWCPKLKIKTNKSIENWVQVQTFPELLSEFLSLHLHQPWLSAGLQNCALLCNCPKSIRRCFTCTFIFWCKYWQWTIVGKSTYDNLLGKRANNNSKYLRRCQSVPGGKISYVFLSKKNCAGHQKHSQNDEFRLFIVNYTCFGEKYWAAGIMSSILLKKNHLFIWHLLVFRIRTAQS